MEHSDDIQRIGPAELDERYRHLRLERPSLADALAESLRRYGQLSPLIVTARDDVFAVVDGFKRLDAARMLGLEDVLVRRVVLSEQAAIAAVYHCSPKTNERVPVVDPVHHPRKPRRNDIEQLNQKMVDLGEVAEELAAGVLRTQRYRGARLAHVLGLPDRYSADDLLTAMKRAVRYKAFDSKTVQRILERTAEPRALPDTLEAAAAARLAEVARQSNVQPRPISDYARAFGGLPAQEEE